MTAGMARLWARLQAWLAVAGLVMAAIFAAWVKGRRSGGERVRARAAEDARKQAGERAHADNEAARDDDPAERLRRDWRRP